MLESSLAALMSQLRKSTIFTPFLDGACQLMIQHSNALSNDLEIVLLLKVSTICLQQNYTTINRLVGVTQEKL